ncbi:MAG: hypothetical protein NC043_02860 [Muribaculaceae bacterium]|nr:hypothetical protein [Muribaculaceae bacterium]
MAFDTESFRRELDRRGAERIEGIWQFTSDGATVAISSTGGADHPGDAGKHRTYSIILIDSPSRALRPGTELGTITAEAAQGRYEARIYTRSEGSRLFNQRKFTLELDEAAGYIRFYRHRSSISINLWHFVPFLWRYSVRRNDDSARSTPGCVRIYPAPALPLEPIYL